MSPPRSRASTMTPSTPAGPSYASAFSTPPLSTTSSSSSCYSPMTPMSPTHTGRREREIIMGGLVSRSPHGDEEADGYFDEKRQMSIEVPGIVLTEPASDSPPRTPSPPPKSILLLPPASLPIPTDGATSKSQRCSHVTLLTGQAPSRVCAALRSVVLVSALILGGYHLYTLLDFSPEDVLGQF